MPEFFLELFSEEIPARMQAQGAADLARLVTDALAALTPANPRTWHGPRRIAYAAEIAPGVAASRGSERGPRVSAPEQAVAGFLRKHGATRDDLRAEGDFWMLERATDAVPAARLIAEAMPRVLRRMPWPKSMRWGTSRFTWVRPLRRIVCLLDGAVVPFALAEGDDDAHGLASDNLTEGHRFMAPGAFAVESAADCEAKLRERFVAVNSKKRAETITDGLSRLAAERGLKVVEDDNLISEVAGLVEWPVPFLGRIDPNYMDLPPEVRQVSMRVNQRTFALTDAAGAPAPWFGFVANLEPTDGGAATIAGNERVLRARFADARHFWDFDRKTRLADRLDALKAVTFHAKLGTQYNRAQRIAALARHIAPHVGADPALAERAGLLAKADLTTGMVAEFPELQGVMGGYYARPDEGDAIAYAIRDHYAPKGPNELPPRQPITMAVALADKVDQLARFFSIGEKPTGSGDPYALRRAALGVLRYTFLGQRLPLRELFASAGASDTEELLSFMRERLRVIMRAEGKRHDILSAVFAVSDDDDFYRIGERVDSLTEMLGTPDGTNLLAGFRRAANILRAEDGKDGPHAGPADAALLVQREETDLADTYGRVHAVVGPSVVDEDFPAAMRSLAQLRAPLDAFFDRVTVNAPEPELRRNRLALLAQVRDTMNQVADFSKIEG